MSQLSELLKKVIPAPALDLASLLITPYVSQARALGKVGLTQKVAIPMKDLVAVMHPKDGDEFANLQALRDAAASANADLILYAARVQ